MLVFSDPKRRGAGRLVAAEAVVEDCLGPVQHRNPDPLPALDHVGASLADEIDGLRLTAAQGGQPHRAVGSDVATGCFGRRLDLIHERGGQTQLAGEQVHVRAGA